MLERDLKKKIDDLRDTLVGVVPNPMYQIEQITQGLFYKFMWDMDNEVRELGGNPKFFTGQYEKYSWDKLFAPDLGGEERLKLYSSAIEEIGKNKSIPSAVREIFNRAFLAHNDPRVLKIFLKDIDEFDYKDSEIFGDAYEYLLSFLGTQGDAGQFRTPRHIIDFIVSCVDPQKGDTICDPACGTAGFIISANKHILKENTKDKQGDLLTPDDRKKISNNLVGYELDPMMVKLATANMYLHDFLNPNIHPYNTLSSEVRWNENFDIILANPPFMTPKGGIKPHKRFTVQANKSEVLFVDYIAEHLSPTGRAGVIVPEGIIFQSSNAYKALRKLLVDEYLWAVVSLPAGVFNPYSGVKTSILLMDKVKAKQSDSILFLTVNNDGYDLGAQRREIDKNDLPEILDIVKTGNFEGSEIAHLVEKSKIEASGDWNLSGERYISTLSLNTEFKMVSLNEISDPNHPYPIGDGDHGQIKSTFYQNEGIPYIRVGDMDWNGNISLNKIVYISREVHNQNKKSHLFPGDILISKTGATIGKVAIIPEHIKESNTTASVGKVSINKLLANSKYVANIMMSKPFNKIIWSVSQKSAQPGFNIKDLKEFKIPLPPLSIQEEIVTEIEGYQKIIDGAKQVVDNYKPSIKIDSDWEMVKLNDVCNKVTDGSHNPPKGISNGLMMISSKNIQNNKVDFDNPRFIDEESFNKENKRTDIETGDVLLTIVGTIGRSAVYLESYPKVTFQRSVAVLKIKDNINPFYLCYMLQSNYLQTNMLSRSKGVAQKGIYLKDIKELDIPLPDLSTQQEIISQIEAEQEMVNSNKKLIEIYEQKIKDKIADVWGE